VAVIVVGSFSHESGNPQESYQSAGRFGPSGWAKRRQRCAHRRPAIQKGRLVDFGGLGSARERRLGGTSRCNDLIPSWAASGAVCLKLFFGKGTDPYAEK